MRLFVVTLLGILAFAVVAAPCLAAPPDAGFASVDAPGTTVGVPVDRLFPVDRNITADWFWSSGLMIGYISLGLKSQLRRRGFLDGPRGRTFSGLISLARKPAVPPAAHNPDRRSGDGPRSS